jgi:hypothetical protein
MLKIFLLSVLVLGCGGSKEETEYVPVGPGPQPPSPNPNPRPGAGKSFSEIQKVLNESCGGAACHAGASFLQSEAALRSNAQVKNRITSDSMPPRYAPNYFLWEDGTRKRDVLKFLSAQ